ncbi:lysozyme-like domain-containing protein [Aspergillus karnatakaensis]|uniref:lysozyme n=1 Tax=Aspergillus karnatakaensis TaxID=1810916 RepID=UPI003CCD21BE
MQTIFTLLPILPSLFPALTTAACIGPPVNTATLSLIKSFETFQAAVYDDGYGNPTIGYGHLCPDWSCSDISYPQPLSESDAVNLLADDLAGYQNAVTTSLATPVVLNANQYGALVSWTFNVGSGAMGSSSLVSRMNAGEDVGVVASEELPKWKYANGEVSNGLVRRRAAEVELFNTASSVGALPVGC